MNLRTFLIGIIIPFLLILNSTVFVNVSNGSIYENLDIGNDDMGDELLPEKIWEVNNSIVPQWII